MRKIRAEIRNVPDTILKLIKTMGKTIDPSRKLTNAEVVSYAIAKLTGVYTPNGDGSYHYVPQYEVCPECSGLIDKDAYNNPPPNDEAHVEEWKQIRRQHVTKCAWVTMAQAGRFSRPTDVEKVSFNVKNDKPKKSNVVEMRHTDPAKVGAEALRKNIDAEITEPVDESIPEVQPDAVKVIPKPVEQPSLDDMSFEGEKQETYIDEFGAVQTRVVRVKQKVLVDDSQTIHNQLTDPRYKDKDSMSVTMEMGNEKPDGTRSHQVLSSEQKEKLGGRESALGKVTEKNVDDKTLVLKHEVEGKPPEILTDKKTGDIVEKDISLAKPLRMAKERVNKDSATYKSLDEIKFEGDE